jgi:hypothetical protein
VYHYFSKYKLSSLKLSCLAEFVLKCVCVCVVGNERKRVCLRGGERERERERERESKSYLGGQ